MLTIFEHLLSPVEEDEAQQEVDDTKQAHTTGSSEEQQKQGQPEGVPEYNNLKEHIHTFKVYYLKSNRVSTTWTGWLLMGKSTSWAEDNDNTHVLLSAYAHIYL